MKKILMLIILVLFCSIVHAQELKERESQDITRVEARNNMADLEKQEFPPIKYTIDMFPSRKPLSTYDFIYGSVQLSSLILSFILVILITMMIIQTLRNKILSPWNFISLAGIIFMMNQILETINCFGIYSSSLQYFMPSIIIALLIAALMRQKSILSGCYK